MIGCRRAMPPLYSTSAQSNESSHPITLKLPRNISRWNRTRKSLRLSPGATPTLFQGAQTSRHSRELKAPVPLPLTANRGFAIGHETSPPSSSQGPDGATAPLFQRPRGPRCVIKKDARRSFLLDLTNLYPWGPNLWRLLLLNVVSMHSQYLEKRRTSDWRSTDATHG